MDKKFVMCWNKYEVADWVNSVAREKEVPECGDLFELKNIDGQKLWDYHKYDRLQEIDVPTVGMRLTLHKKIKTLTSDFYQ